MTIQENLELLQNTKEQIRQAINSKGVTLEQSAPFSAYATAIMAIPTGGESIPEGLWKFNVTQEGETNVIWVEGFMTNDKSNTWQETVVKIYEDPNGEPVNSITYSFNSKLSDSEVSQTNSAAGLYAEQYSAFNTSNDPIVLGLSCNTAGYYYIEVVGHTNPRFYNDEMVQIYPDNYVNS